MKNINELVNSQLTTRIKNYDKLSNFVYELLHLNKSKHKIWVVAKRNKLTLLTDNPYLGTQIRYQQQTICDEINRKFLMELNQVHVKLVPPTSSLQRPKEERFKISENTGSVLASIAEEIDDAELKQSLIDLATRK